MFGLVELETIWQLTVFILALTHIQKNELKKNSMYLGFFAINDQNILFSQ